MDVTTLLANDRARPRLSADMLSAKDHIKQFGHASAGQAYPQSIRQSNITHHTSPDDLLPASTGVMNAQRAVDAYQQHLTRGTTPKKVAFELILDEDSKQRARIPLRVLINQHDTTESIVSTVKNFYGIYEGRGVSFEDGQGNTLIAKYENFKNDMIVYVRVIPYDTFLNPYASAAPYHVEEIPHHKATLGEPFQMLPPHVHQGYDSSQVPSRPTSRLARKRSISPSRDRRSASSQKAGSRSGVRSRDTSAHGSYHDDAANTYSDSDNGHGSTTSSRKAKSEQITAEISLENIVQDGRRMRPKFDSSELPLFVPPQVPLTTSTSSISPQRRSIGQEGPSPFARPAARPFQSQNQTLPSPQSLGYHEQVASWQIPTAGPQSSNGGSQYGHRLRERSSLSNIPNGRGGYNAQGILPTPDPTIASCISDEDVARQLIALGDASNFSHGRASASTAADDAFSGIADIASSTGATSDSDSQSEDESLPSYHKGLIYSGKRRRQSYTSDSEEEEEDEYRDSEAMIKSEFDEYDNEMPKAKRIKTKAGSVGPVKPRPLKIGTAIKVAKPNSSRFLNGSKKTKRQGSTSQGLSGIAAPRKISSASAGGVVHQLAADEEDLSTKPRCQRCRKSKKGCDRQRPCQRCKDAGIGIDGCISEDEGNGRKGRYGRHMGVAIKKNSDSAIPTATEVDDFHAVGAILQGMATSESPDKNKKRKR